MQVAVIATLCRLAAATTQPCVEEIVAENVELAQCAGPFAQQALAKWMEEHPIYRSGWRLAKWGCAIGGYRKAVPA